MGEAAHFMTAPNLLSALHQKRDQQKQQQQQQQQQDETQCVFQDQLSCQSAYPQSPLYHL